VEAFMKKHRRIPFVRGFAGLSILAMTFAVAPTLAGASGISPTPAVPSCPPTTTITITDSVAHRTVLYTTFFEGPSTDTANEEASGTKSFTVSASVTGEASAIFASIEAQVGVSLEESVTADYGSTYGVTVPSGETLYVAYVYKWVAVSGVSVYTSATCVNTDTDFSANGPEGDGWIQSTSPIT
jgi:hypothetical protein